MADAGKIQYVHPLTHTLVLSLTFSPQFLAVVVAPGLKRNC